VPTARLTSFLPADGLGPVAISPDGRSVATAGTLPGGVSGLSSQLRVFDTETGEQRFWMPITPAVIGQLVYNPDGRRIAVAGAEALTVVDARTPNVLWQRKAQRAEDSSIVYRPDATEIVTCEFGGVMEMNAESGKLTSLVGFAATVQVRDVAVSPDGTSIANAGLRTGPTGGGHVEVRGVMGHGLRWHVATADAVTAIRYDSTGQVLVVSTDGAVLILDAATGVTRSTLASADRGAFRIALSPDGRHLAVVDGKRRKLSVFDGAALTTPGVPTARYHTDVSVRPRPVFSADSSLLLVGAPSPLTSTKAAWALDAATGRRAFAVEHDAVVESGRFAPDGSALVTAAGDGLRIFALDPGAVELHRLPHGGPVRSVAFSGDGTLVATASADGTARVFTSEGVERAKLRHGGAVHWTGFTPDQGRAVSACEDATARVMDATSGAERASFAHDGPVTAATVSPDGTIVATASADNTARLFDVGGGQQRKFNHNGVVRAVAFSPDGSRLATGADDQIARLFKISTGAPQFEFPHHGTVTAIAFSPDGARLATASEDGTARIFDNATGVGQREFTHGGPVHAVVFSPDGTMLGTASEDGTARIFDGSSGARRHELPHAGPVHAVAFSSDGTRLATACQDGTARIYDTRSGEHLVEFAHDGPTYAVAFNPTGDRLASGSEDNTARIWTTP